MVNYFTDIGANFACKISRSVAVNDIKTDTLFLISSNPEEVNYLHNIIPELRNGKSLGFDRVTTEMLKEVLGEITGLISHLIYNMFSLYFYNNKHMSVIDNMN